MGRLSFGRMLDCLFVSSCSKSCFCINSLESQDDDEVAEMKPLVASDGDRLLRLKDLVSGQQTLALQLKPKTVVLKVSMHCNGCARKVEKHVSKIEAGVISYKVDLETKMVVITGDVLPSEVLESVSKVKTAQLWTAGT
ncbi:hypothetical protein Ancab_006966 [Ancistrocladus abbreviatus]